MDALHNHPDLRKRPFLRPHSQQLVAEDVAFLWARHYPPTTLQRAVDRLKSFYVLVPVTRRPRLYQDLTCTTPEDVEDWLQAAHHKGLAPSTLNTIVSAPLRFFVFPRE